MRRQKNNIITKITKRLKITGSVKHVKYERMKKVKHKYVNAESPNRFIRHSKGK